MILVMEILQNIVLSFDKNLPPMSSPHPNPPDVVVDLVICLNVLVGYLTSPFQSDGGRPLDSHVG